VDRTTGDIGDDKRTALEHLIGQQNTANTWITLPPSNATTEVIHWLYRNVVGNSRLTRSSLPPYTTSSP
jgi:hypothetical protein